MPTTPSWRTNWRRKTTWSGTLWCVSWLRLVPEWANLCKQDWARASRLLRHLHQGWPRYGVSISQRHCASETEKWIQTHNRTSGLSLSQSLWRAYYYKKAYHSSWRTMRWSMAWMKKWCTHHSFRHRYAKNFLEKFNDLALLADLMGHESIERHVSIYEEAALSNKR